MAATPYPAYRGLSQAHTSQARASAAPAGQDIRHGTCNFAGWRLRLARPTESSYRLKPLRPAQAQRRRARYQAQYLYRRVATVALPGLQSPLTGSNLAGPRKRSAAGQDIRHGTCIAGWRLRLTRPTGSSHRLIPRRPAQAHGLHPKSWTPN